MRPSAATLDTTYLDASLVVDGGLTVRMPS
jgi:hypothetical protein